MTAAIAWTACVLLGCVALAAVLWLLRAWPFSKTPGHADGRRDWLGLRLWDTFWLWRGGLPLRSAWRMCFQPEPGERAPAPRDWGTSRLPSLAAREAARDAITGDLAAVPVIPRAAVAGQPPPAFLPAPTQAEIDERDGYLERGLGLLADGPPLTEHELHVIAGKFLAAQGRPVFTLPETEPPPDPLPLDSEPRVSAGHAVPARPITEPLPVFAPASDSPVCTPAERSEWPHLDDGCWPQHTASFAAIREVARG